MRGVPSRTSSTGRTCWPTTSIAAMKQIFALQINTRPAPSQVSAASERRRTTGIGGQEAGKFRLEGFVLLRVEERRFQFLERRDQDFGNEDAAEPVSKVVRETIRLLKSLNARIVSSARISTPNRPNRFALSRRGVGGLPPIGVVLPKPSSMMQESFSNSPVIVEIVALLRPLILAISAREIGCRSERMLSRIRRLTRRNMSCPAALTSARFGLRVKL